MHINQSLRPRLMVPRYLALPVVVIGDPAGVSKSSIYEVSSFDVLKHAGFRAFPAPTNNIDPRIRAIEAFLLGQRDGGPALLIDRQRCPTIVRALAGGYRFEKTRAGKRKPVPDKNDYSHPMDAAQYAALAAHGGLAGALAQRLSRGMRPRAGVPFTARAWT